MTMYRVDCPPHPQFGQVYFDTKDSKTKVNAINAWMFYTPIHIGSGGLMGGAERGIPKDGEKWYGDGVKLKLVSGYWVPWVDVGDTKWEGSELLRWDGDKWKNVLTPHPTLENVTFYNSTFTQAWATGNPAVQSFGNPQFIDNPEANHAIGYPPQDYSPPVMVKASAKPKPAPKKFVPKTEPEPDVPEKTRVFRLD